MHPHPFWANLYARTWGRSATMAIPIIAHAAIMWGILFLCMGSRRRGVMGWKTTIDTLPAWAWGVMMIVGGLAVLISLRPWAVAILSSVLSFYSCTLALNALRYDNVSWTGPIWPTTTTIVLILASGRVGVRKAHHAPIRR